MSDLLYQCKIQSKEGWTGHRWVPKNRLDDVFTLPSPTGPRDYYVTVAYEPPLPEETFSDKTKKSGK